ncbi:MAG: PAS domain-containing protein [Deltaproteobacteria bacterium]|nr:PAS domain-containing protein [Deltaproteobacteria bacterium]
MQLMLAFFYDYHTLALLLVILFFLFLHFKTIQTIKKSVQKMTEFSKKISEGDFNHSLNIRSRDELGALANSLNSMKDQLSSLFLDLVQEKQKLSSLLSGMYDGVLAIDPNKKIILYNKRVKEIFHLKEGDVRGRSLLEFIQNPDVISFFERALKEKKIFQKQIKIIDNTVKHYEIVVSPLQQDQENMWGVVAIFHDISDLKSVEQMRIEFVANVSHEFKTPLTSILGFTDTLINDKDIHQTQKEKFLKIIKQNVERLSYLMKDLLSLSSLESEVMFHKLCFKIQPFVEKLMLEFEKQAQEKEITLKTHIKVESMTADEPKLHQALYNLLDNAMKYTEKGGVITLSIQEEKGFLKLAVEDSGLGIHSTHLPRVFERFYRVDKGRDREMGGTGLGLAIVKHIALLHGGSVEVESEQGKGSLFSILIPLF